MVATLLSPLDGRPQTPPGYKTAFRGTLNVITGTSQAHVTLMLPRLSNYVVSSTTSNTGPQTESKIRKLSTLPRAVVPEDPAKTSQKTRGMKWAAPLHKIVAVDLRI